MSDQDIAREGLADAHEAIAEQAREREMNLTGYDPEAIERAEREMARVMGEFSDSGIKERRQAAAFCTKVLAQLIADDVLMDAEPSPRWVAEYRYTRDLAAHLYGQAEASLARIDGR